MATRSTRLLFILLFQSPDCFVNIGVKSVNGNTITLVNLSDGVKRGLRYRWNFNDNSLPLVTTDSVVTHQYADIKKAKEISLTPLSTDCKEQVIPIQTAQEKSTYTPTYRPFGTVFS